MALVQLGKEYYKTSMCKTSIFLPSSTTGGLPKFRDTTFALVQIKTKIQQPIEEYLDSRGVFVPDSHFTCGICKFLNPSEDGGRITVHYQIQGSYTRPVQYKLAWHHDVLISGVLIYRIASDGAILEFIVEAPEISRLDKL